MALSKNAKHLLKIRYCHRNEQPQDVYSRVANTLSLGDNKFEKRLNKAMYDGIFLPNSPCIRNAGQKKGMLHACFVLDIQDNMESISDTLKDMIIIFKNGGGIGINFSKLRPQNAELSTGGKSSGVVSFMSLFDTATEVVKQGGFRRGALMGVLNFEHAEIIEFIRSKLTNQLTNFNISVLVSDAFMKKIEKGEDIELKNPKDNETWSVINSKTIFDVMCFAAWNSGDPGLLFYNRINKDNPLFPKIKIKATNPCITGDTLIAVADGREAVSIKQLAEENKDIPVYCADKDGYIHIRYGRNPRKTSKKARIYKITLDDGTTIKATYNHKFILKNGKEKQLKELKIGDSLQRFDKYQFSYGKKDTKYWGIQRARNNTYQEHRLIMEFNLGRRLSKKEEVHHRNYNGLDNHPVNLTATKKHKSEFHNIQDDKNPMRRFPEKNWMNNPLKQQEMREKYHIGKKRSEQTCRNISESLLGLSLEEKNHKINCKCGVCKAKRKKKEKVCYNHKIINITYVEKEDVYNLTVDEFHNYAVITSNEQDKKSGIIIKNCGEVPLPNYGACCLGSINISKLVKYTKFDFKQFAKYLELASRALRNNNAISWYPLTEITKVMKELDPIGVGIMGFADCLIKLGIDYDSEDTLKFIDELGKIYKEVTDEVAKKCFYKRIIAPTGSLSILADCSSGIEPIFETAFERHLTVGILEETREIYKSKHVRTAHQILPEWHLKIQAQWQKWLDGSISKTINLPSGASVDDIKKIYLTAWKMGCKGITIFREGSKEGVLKKITCEGTVCHL